MKRLVIGVGNGDRGDDGAALAAVRALAGAAPHDVGIAESRGEPASLIDLWTGFDIVILVDACASGAVPGTILRFEAHEAPLPEHFSAVSTHGFGVGAAIELGRAIGALPKALIVFGIEARSFEAGAALSPEVAEACGGVVARVLDELACLST